MDLVIAVVVFGFIAVIFYSLLMVQQKPSVDELRNNAQTIQQRLAAGQSGCGPLSENQTITSEQLACLYNKTPSELRQLLNVKGNFCIYLEDSDGTVFVVANDTVNLANAHYKTGVGDPGLKVAGIACGAVIP
jgi:hypothetical protein